MGLGVGVGVGARAPHTTAASSSCCNPVCRNPTRHLLLQPRLPFPPLPILFFLIFLFINTQKNKNNLYLLLTSPIILRNKLYILRFFTPNNVLYLLEHVQQSVLWPVPCLWHCCHVWTLSVIFMTTFYVFIFLFCFNYFIKDKNK